MKKLLTTVAFAAILAAAPAIAEEYPAPAAEQPPAAATETPAGPDADAATKPLPGMEAPADTAETPAVEQPGVEAPAAIASAPSYVNEQAAEERLVSAWIGQSIYNPADENIGDVNDLLIGPDGAIKAVIVGVGGFLGIGEKAVAVSYAALTMNTDANGSTKLVLNATRDQLDAAPQFVTLEAKLRAAQETAPDPMLAPTTPTN